ncbi:MAG: 4-alpha-glucanotransferase [candidate division WOR-3 bacterium]|nr:MAG: 4-alpha-glucanotransferase [candidate division WOR-3 bacterium]
MNRRGCGILLHITSLPSSYGIGDLGPRAYQFVDFLAEARQRFWQILPLNPTDVACDNSPYHSISAFAYNPLLISPEFLIKKGLLKNADEVRVPDFPEERVDYRAVTTYKKKIFRSAFERFRARRKTKTYKKFCSANAHWLDDFCLFVALRDHFHGRVWSDWPIEMKNRQQKALNKFKKELREEIEMEKFLQYTVHHQWFSLKQYCNKRGIRIIGDIPIYVDYDSVDVWSNPEMYKLDRRKRSSVVAGVPPDYYSDTGQLWGNPLYRWNVLKKSRYDWWIRRVEHNAHLFDIVRIDHFRGLVAYWEVSAHEKTAIHGKWIKAPAMDFLGVLTKRFHHLPIIAEDLGTITQDVRAVIRHFKFPGMKVLLFAFGEDNPMHPYLPHTYENHCIVYTGTHDNNTIRGWFEKEATPEHKKRLFRYLGQRVSINRLHWEFIRLAMRSVADMVIVPMQDILGLGMKARMNHPGTSQGNWRWRVSAQQLTPTLAKKLSHMVETYGRV